MDLKAIEDAFVELFSCPEEEEASVITKLLSLGLDQKQIKLGIYAGALELRRQSEKVNDTWITSTVGLCKQSA